MTTLSQSTAVCFTGHEDAEIKYSAQLNKQIKFSALLREGWLSCSSFSCIFFFFRIRLLPNAPNPSSVVVVSPSNFHSPRILNVGCSRLMAADCSNSHEFPTFKIGGTLWYQIIDKISTNKFKVLDLILSNTLKDRKCIPRFNLPQSPSISFTIASNQTSLFSCLNQTSNERIHYHFENYSSFYNAECGPYTFYYLDQTAVYPPPEQRNIPADCEVFQLLIDYNRRNSSGLLELLTPEYTIEWNASQLSQACYDCYHGGGQCLQNIRNEFHCKKGNSNKKILFIGSMPIAALTSILIMVFIFICAKRAEVKQEHGKDIELFLKNNGNLVPKRYKHSSIKKMTNSYRENLGKGGYGTVYKGQLPDGHLVAVKVMNESNGNGEDFINEVASISRTSHINIVPLLGFCFEGSKRALIYEFMPNGSLEKFIRNSSLGWDKLFEIAVGVARGL